MTGYAKTYTPDEYAAHLKVSLKTIYRQLRTGALKAEKIGRQWRIIRFVITEQDRTGQEWPKG